MTPAKKNGSNRLRSRTVFYLYSFPLKEVYNVKGGYQNYFSFPIMEHLSIHGDFHSIACIALKSMSKNSQMSVTHIDSEDKN